MPHTHRRSSSRTQQPAQRRPRTDKACSYCRAAKQRCEPTEYGTNDRTCRRCSSHGLDCNLPRVARSQSPASTFGVQGPAPIQHHATPHTAGGAAEELPPSSETAIQYMLPQVESARFPMMESWPPLVVRSEGEQGPTSSSIASGQTALQMPSYLLRASSMEGYQQNFLNVPQDCTAPNIYPEYYGQTISSHAYMASYAPGGEVDDASNLGYATQEPQLHTTSALADEQDAGFSHPGNQSHDTVPYPDEQDEY